MELIWHCAPRNTTGLKTLPEGREFLDKQLGYTNKPWEPGSLEQGTSALNGAYEMKLEPSK